jgi:hypothetical protein
MKDQPDNWAANLQRVEKKKKEKTRKPSPSKEKGSLGSVALLKSRENVTQTVPPRKDNCCMTQSKLKQVNTKKTTLHPSGTSMKVTTTKRKKDAQKDEQPVNKFTTANAA